jgi:Cytochrome c554 and c-prime
VHFSPRAFLILTAVLISSLAVFLVSSDAWVAFPQTFAPKPLPAFYAGGLEQGSGGQLEYKDVTPDQLFLPSPARNSSNALLPNNAFPDPEGCGLCHSSIHASWQSSLHSRSATDALYLKVKEQFVVERGEPSVRLCAACHAPVALMTGEVGLYNRESVSSQQGVSCGFCHTVEKVHGDSGAWEVNPARVRAYVGSGMFSSSISKWLVYAKPNPHREDMLRPALLTGQVCQSCHSFKINNVAVQSTWEEFQASSFAKRGGSCQSCHFTESGLETREPGEVAVGRARDHVYAHTLRGGSTIEAPNPQQNLEMLRRALRLEVKRVDAKLDVIVRNTGAAHTVPTGVADLRELWLEVIAKDAKGAVVFSSGVADAAGELHKDSRIFHQVLGDERGNPIVRHDIWRAKKILKDTRIPTDGFKLESFALPSSAASVKVRLLWRDVPASFAAWVLGRSGSSIKSHMLLEQVLN